ncbi:bacterio-opsin activator domain-containing protein [Natronolimnohabitans innermongolicus]|uniref:PAS/PAC sensor protein n=1 Tax=Natronolimnohabitans innermongolicus JCM 12255 TaxID=1227499 RepID=L9XJ15_9EURY|nr:bacterio-opsin activator domain-containing protein [Natronolimnohabitans innermongolicus]ELY60653.1 PAS/PAC sensor protein [Natronolimnohabitans innermongolicus JCM 12255]
MDSPVGQNTELQTRVRQQEVVAELGQQALETDNLEQLMYDATVALAETLDSDYAKVLELRADGDEMLLRQGVGWRDGLVGETMVPADVDSQAGYTLLSAEPIIVDDLRADERFSGPELLTSHTIVSGVSVIIGSVEEPWGALGVHTAERHEFTDHDVNFVQSIANVLAAAITEVNAKQQLHERENDLKETFDRITDGFIGVDADWAITYTNDRGKELINLDGEGLVNRNFWDVFEPALGTTFEEQYREVAATQEPTSFEEYYPPLDGWFEVHVYPSASGLSIYFRDITEHRKRERDRALFRTLLDYSTDAVFVEDPKTGEIIDVNDTAIRQLGYSREELLGLTVSDIDTDLPTLENYQAFVSNLEAEGNTTFNGTHQRKDGSTFPVEVNVSYIELDQLDQAYVLALARDITERKRVEERVRENEAALERLNVATQELIDADPAEITFRTADIAQSVLDVEYAALWHYDETIGELDEYASRTSPNIDSDTVHVSTHFSERAWQTFISGDINVENDIESSEGEAKMSPLRSCVFAPLGRHGVICAGATRANTFDDRLVDLVETVATTVKTAWDRADGEAKLEQQNTELVRLDRLNMLIRDIDQALVQAETVGSIDEAVCNRLAESALFEFAWIGEFDTAAGTVAPREWAGITNTSLEQLTTGEEPGLRKSQVVDAVKTGEVQVVADTATDPRATPWREAALESGGRSCFCIPLVYDESVYGVLVVYGRTPQPDERNVDVLSELGQTIAHAIHAVETRVTQQTDSVVELTLQTTAETPLVRFALETDCVIEFEGVTPRDDGDMTVFFTARNVSPDEMMAAGEQSIIIKNVRPLAEQDTGTLFKARLAGSTLASKFLEQGATVRSVNIDSGTATVVVALPETTDVREFVEDLKRDVPDLTLLARRSRTKPPDTGQRLQTAFEQHLTSRQQEILQLAYRSGYFESPRVQTGKELSDALDLSQSTFNYHLRGGERKLLAVVFDHAPDA